MKNFFLVLICLFFSACSLKNEKEIILKANEENKEIKEEKKVEIPKKVKVVICEELASFDEKVNCLRKKALNNDFASIKKLSNI